MKRWLLNSLCLFSEAFFTTDHPSNGEKKPKWFPFHLNLIVTHAGCIIAKLWCVWVSGSSLCSPISHIPFWCYSFPWDAGPTQSCPSCHNLLFCMCVHLPQVATWMQKNPNQTKTTTKTSLKLLCLMCFLCIDNPHTGLGTNIPHILQFPICWASLSVTILNADNSTTYVLRITALQKYVRMHP